MAGASSSEEENYWPGYVDALTTMLMVLTFVMMVLGIVVFTLSQNVSKNVVAAVAQAVDIDTSTLDGRTPDALRQAVINALKAKLARPAEPAAPQQTAVTAAPEAPADAMGGAPAAAPTPTLPTFASGAATLPPNPAAVANETTPAQAVEIASLPPQGVAAPQGGQRDTIVQSEAPPPEPPRQRDASLTDTGDGLRIIFKNGAVQLDQMGATALQAYTSQFGTAAFVVRASAFVASSGATDARRRAYYRAMLVREHMIRTGLSAGRISVEVRDNDAPDSQDLVQVFARTRGAR